MKLSEFRKLIREEVRKVVSEAVVIDPVLQTKLKASLVARKRNPEDENAHDELQNSLMQIYKKAGRKDAKELAAGNMEDEITMTGPLSALVSLIKDTLSEPQSSDSSKEIYILDDFGRYESITIEKTATGSEIRDRGFLWKYSYAGSPMDLLKDLIVAKAISKVGSKYRESDTERESVRKAIKANPKFKKQNI